MPDMKKSYTVNVTTAGKVVVKPSHLLPGYTSYHQPTPELAKKAYIAGIEAEIKSLEAKVALVTDTLEEE